MKMMRMIFKILQTKFNININQNFKKITQLIFPSKQKIQKI